MASNCTAHGGVWHRLVFTEVVRDDEHDVRRLGTLRARSGVAPTTQAGIYVCRVLGAARTGWLGVTYERVQGGT